MVFNSNGQTSFEILLVSKQCSLKRALKRYSHAMLGNYLSLVIVAFRAKQTSKKRGKCSRHRIFYSIVFMVTLFTVSVSRFFSLSFFSTGTSPIKKVSCSPIRS